MNSRFREAPSPPGLHEHLGASLKAQWKRCRKQLKRCQQEFSETAVHDLRVEIRRLLSNLELLGAFVSEDRIEKARRLLKKRLAFLGELRDTQVQLLAVTELARRFDSAKPFQARLIKREKRCTREARKRIQRIRPARLGRLIDGFREELRARRRQRLGAQDGAAVIRAVDRAFREVARLKARRNAADTDTIHRTRIAFKRFRYMAEALAPLLPEVTKDRLAAMHEYQTIMGRIQDIEILSENLDKFLAKEKRSFPDSRALRAELRRERQALIQACLKGADQLHEFWPSPGSRKTTITIPTKEARS